MKHIPEDIRGAVVGFVVLLSKGLLEDDKWDWDIEQFDWQRYKAGFADPIALKTTLSIFLNTLQLNDKEEVTNYHEARFRGFQYFRAFVDPSYSSKQVTPPFEQWEFEEPDWLTWES